MSLLYLTADEIGAPTGGGLVTKHESDALNVLGPCEIWDRDRMGYASGLEPWLWDDYVSDNLDICHNLAHIYAGTWGKTVARLKGYGCKVCITIAAHDRHVSRREHEELGVGFPYPHLTEEPLWQRYIEGYRLADVIVCPGEVAARTVRAYGQEFKNKKIVVIPHGCEIPKTVAPLPKIFTVGYLGSFGADKGVRYLLEAWKHLNYKDAVLVLGGKDSTSPWAHHLISTYGGSNVVLRGWVENVSDFYNSCSIYVQPSATEGFGIEVVEAMAHGRPVLCSAGAGAVGCVKHGETGYNFGAGDVKNLADLINRYKTKPGQMSYHGENAREWARYYTWDKVRKRYQDLWRSML